VLSNTRYQLIANANNYMSHFANHMYISLEMGSSAQAMYQLQASNELL